MSAGSIFVAAFLLPVGCICTHRASFPLEIIFLSKIFIHALTRVPSDGTAYAVYNTNITDDVSSITLLQSYHSYHQQVNSAISVFVGFSSVSSTSYSVFFVSSSDNLTSPLPRPTSAHILYYLRAILYYRYNKYIFDAVFFYFVKTLFFVSMHIQCAYSWLTC